MILMLCGISYGQRINTTWLRPSPDSLGMILMPQASNEAGTKFKWKPVAAGDLYAFLSDSVTANTTWLKPEIEAGNATRMTSPGLINVSVGDSAISPTLWYVNDPLTGFHVWADSTGGVGETGLMLAGGPDGGFIDIYKYADDDTGFALLGVGDKTARITAMQNTLYLESAGARYLQSTGEDFRISAGTGSPEGVVTGSPGDLYVNVSGGAGTTLYVKESGAATNTGWSGL